MNTHSSQVEMRRLLAGTVQSVREAAVRDSTGRPCGEIEKMSGRTGRFG